MVSANSRFRISYQLIPALLQAMAFSNPSGKQNSFAGQIMPDAVMIECKQDKIPLSYVNAFEIPVPVWGSNPKIVETSIQRLAEHVDCMDRAYNLQILSRGWFAPRFPDKKPEKSKSFENFTALIDDCVECLWGENE